MADAFADRVVGTLDQLAPGLTASIRAREVITPLDLERDYGMTGGHPLHGEAALDQWFLWRPFLGSGRYRLPVDGLYLCGSGAHPGGGVTGQPGQNAAREILSDLKRRR
jgi:phytoene dehydrogenase-like protein